MAISKNPSIYDDRSSIGSSEELDEYGVWVKVSPEDFVETRNVAVAEEPDAGVLEELSLDDLNDFADDSGDSPQDIPDLIDYSDEELDDSEITGEAEADLIEGLPESLPEEDRPDLSTQLLMKIADELASIKGELSSLKDELAVIRSEKPVGNAHEKGDDFFEGDDDDKIALTGDELNNILHTADFTEETGADAGENLGDDFVDISLQEEDILDTPDAFADFEAKDTEDLKALRENGVEPMTPPPEDTSYLEEDSPVEEPFDLAVEPSPDTAPPEDIPMIDGNLFEEVSFDELAGGGESIDLSTIETVEPVEGEPEAAGFAGNIDVDLPPLDLPADGLLAEAEEEEIAFQDDDTEDTFEGLNIDLGLLPDITLDDVPVDIPEEAVTEEESAPQGDDTEAIAGVEDPDIDLDSFPDIPLDDLPVEIPDEAPAEPEAGREIPSGFRNELIHVLEYMDKLLESLPEEKIAEFAHSEHYVTYKKLFDELGIA